MFRRPSRSRSSGSFTTSHTIWSRRVHHVPPNPATDAVLSEVDDLAADVVGFSRLAGADEDRTLARLRALRSDLIDPTIAVHHGRVVKRTGDGILVEFRSVVDAVRCAVEVQSSMIERNAGVPPERRIEFRIGIHLGDVVEEADGDLMGDGVNIAARLEGIAKPGAVCLSEDAYRQVKARLDLAVSDLGETQLKNIAEPMRVYSLQVGLPAQARPLAQAEPVALEKTSERSALPGETVDRGPSLRQFERGPRPGILRRRLGGGHIDRTVPLSRTLRHLAKLDIPFQGEAVDVRTVARELGYNSFSRAAFVAPAIM